MDFKEIFPVLFAFVVIRVISSCYTCIARQIDPMLAIRLDPKTEKRLDRLARKTGRTKTYYAREAILDHLQDLEDAYLAVYRLQHPAKTHSAQDVKRELGL